MKESKMLQELVKEIKSRNEKTRAWVAENPKNRFASLLPEDEAYWVERGITTLEALERDELETYIFDAHKTAFGFKGRHYDFASMSMEELREEADYIGKACQRAMKEEAEQEARSLEIFNELVQKTIASGAGDEETALRWLTQSETFNDGFDVEHWVYNHGILYTDYGKKLVEKLQGLVTFKEWDAA
jgi:hypothetical protein